MFRIAVIRIIDPISFYLIPIRFLPYPHRISVVSISYSTVFREWMSRSIEVSRRGHTTQGNSSTLWLSKKGRRREVREDFHGVWISHFRVSHRRETISNGESQMIARDETCEVQLISPFRLLSLWIDNMKWKWAATLKQRENLEKENRENVWLLIEWGRRKKEGRMKWRKQSKYARRLAAVVYAKLCNRSNSVNFYYNNTVRWQNY